MRIPFLLCTVCSDEVMVALQVLRGPHPHILLRLNVVLYFVYCILCKEIVNDVYYFLFCRQTKLRFLIFFALIITLLTALNLTCKGQLSSSHSNNVFVYQQHQHLGMLLSAAQSL